MAPAPTHTQCMQVCQQCRLWREITLSERQATTTKPNKNEIKNIFVWFFWEYTAVRRGICILEFQRKRATKVGGKDNSTRRSDMSVKIFSFLLKQFSGCSPGNDPPDGTIAMHREFSSGRKYFVYSVFCPQQHQRKEMYNLNAFLPQSIAV